MMRANRFRWGLKIFVLILAAAALAGLVVMSLWNWLAPDLFGWHPISFGQALGLLVLCRLLIGGFRGRGGWHSHWRARLAERLEAMTPEEREKFRAGMHARCGWHSAPETKATSQSSET
jgi:hypothetical protein